MALLLLVVLVLAMAFVPLLIATFCVWLEHEAETPAHVHR